MYVDTLSLPGDSKDTVGHVLMDLHTTFIVELGYCWLTVAGYQLWRMQTYDIFQSQ